MFKKSYNPYFKSAGALAAFGVSRATGSYMQGRPPASVLYLGSNARSVYVGRRRARRSNSFHARVLKDQPAKHYANSSLTSLTHDTITTVVPTTGITQGTSNTNRIGDYVDLCAIKLKGYFTSAVTSGVYSYRILVGYTGEEYNLPTVLGTGLTSAELFIPNTTANWAVNGIINPKAFTVLHDETIDINSVLTAVSDISSYSFTVPLNTKFEYQAAASIYGKTRNLAVVVIGSVGGGTVGSTSAGATVMSYDLIFK